MEILYPKKPEENLMQLTEKQKRNLDNVMQFRITKPNKEKIKRMKLLNIANTLTDAINLAIESFKVD